MTMASTSTSTRSTTTMEMPMARRALIVLLLLLPCAAIAEDDNSMHRALFDHLQEIRALSSKKAAAEGGDVEQAEGEGDWLVVLGVVEEPHAPVEDVPVVELGDMTRDLFAHIHAVQRKVQEAAEDAVTVNGGTGEGVVELEEKENVKEVEEDGVVDPLVQKRFKLLEAALKGLRDDEDGSPKELRVHGDEDDGAVSLLKNYAQKTYRKLNRSDGEPQLENDQSREVTGEHEQSDNHGDHEHVHGHGHHYDHGHGHGHGHEHHDHHLHHDHHYGDAHASAGFSRVSDAYYHKHDHEGHSPGYQHRKSIKEKRIMLPEELAEDEDLIQYGIEGPVYSNAEQPSRLRGQELGVWLLAMGCSLLVSLASLICLMLLPCIVSNGKPSETVINALASVGAGAMLGDAFLHQLPHAFGKSDSPHSHDTHHYYHGPHSHSHGRDHSSAAGQGHAHSLQDLSVGLAILGGILLFFIVEKIVRRREELSSHGGQRALGHSHHHLQKRKDEVKNLEGPEKIAAVRQDGALENKESKSLETKDSDIKRKSGHRKDTTSVGNAVSTALVQPQQQVEASGRFVLGYLNLFPDAVHNFTDGMALGSAFLLHGTVGGWSRMLFLLAHELPREVGEFEISVKSGFSVFDALAFNFLSALVALAGTAVALMLDDSSGHSSLIEGFIAGGFIYMSVGGVMPSMHDQGSSLISTLSQLVPMVFGMGVAVGISLV